jgi:hypothetical protein
VVKSIEVVDFEEFEQIHAQQLEGDAQMLPEYHVVLHVNHVHDIVGVIFLEKIKDLKLDSSLIGVFLLIFNDF